MNLNFVIHVGFSKTGTTTLQKHLFGKHSQIKYLGKPYQNHYFKNIMHRLMMEESLTYDPASIKQYISDNQLKTFDASNNVSLLSDEMFVSYSKVRDKGLVANRIKEIFFPCKILITIRNQFEILKSAYLSRGRLLMNVPKKFFGLGVRFEDWLSLSYENFERGSIAHADFFKTIDFYSKLFGKENLCVLLLEEFIYNKKEYIKKLSKFLGIDIEESLKCVHNVHEHKEISQATLDFELLRTRFFPLHKIPLISWPLKLYVSITNRSRSHLPANVNIPEKWTDRLEKVYSRGNRELIKNYNLPLEKYGYPV